VLAALDIHKAVFQAAVLDPDSNHLQSTSPLLRPRPQRLPRSRKPLLHEIPSAASTSTFACRCSDGLRGLCGCVSASSRASASTPVSMSRTG